MKKQGSGGAAFIASSGVTDSASARGDVSASTNGISTATSSPKNAVGPATSGGADDPSSSSNGSGSGSGSGNGSGSGSGGSGSGKSIFSSFANIRLGSTSTTSSSLSSTALTSTPTAADALHRIIVRTQGYSGSDLTAVCSEAAMGPIRELGPQALLHVKAEDVRPIAEKDFVSAIENIRPSVSPDSLKRYTEWAEQFGVSR
jgi:Vps4 C terminal oligomerisation domain